MNNITNKVTLFSFLATFFFASCSEQGNTNTSYNPKPSDTSIKPNTPKTPVLSDKEKEDALLNEINQENNEDSAKIEKSYQEWKAKGYPNITRELSTASGYWLAKLKDYRLAALVEITPTNLKYCDPVSVNKYTYAISFDTTKNKIILNNRDGYSTDDSLEFKIAPYDMLADSLILSIKPVLLSHGREEVTFFRVRKKQFDYVKSKLNCTNM